MPRPSPVLFFCRLGAAKPHCIHKPGSSEVLECRYFCVPVSDESGEASAISSLMNRSLKDFGVPLN